jgi:DNA-binding ferritin-like protein
MKSINKNRKKFKNKTKTRRLNSKNNNYSQQNIVTIFLQMLNTVKLYHWKTSSYAQHKATDELYTNLNLNIDNFVEIMLGKTGGRVNLTGQKTLPLLDYTNVIDFTKVYQSTAYKFRSVVNSNYLRYSSIIKQVLQNTLYPFRW